MGQYDLSRIAFIGDYVPRRCGIATFTRDLCESVDKAVPEAECFVVAMNDRPEGYDYPARVRLEVEAVHREDYDSAADFLNIAHVDVVCVQHEYGIYGGKEGSFLLPMLHQLRVPIVTTLHTILTEPNDDQRRVMLELCDVSDRLVVMSQRSVEYLQTIYQVPESKIRLIHHGIPDMPFVDPNYYKDLFGAEGRRVILTFGLLAPNKGIEYMIDAMPRIVNEFPDTFYIVLGATHPHVKNEHGEEYRGMLQQRAAALGVAESVTFRNRFVQTHELCEYLGAADLYTTPYLQEAQIVSGTLAYAMGTGKAVISTPYWYAQDMLAEGRGCLVPFHDAEALAGKVVDLLSNETERHAMRKRAYSLGRTMIWPAVASEYLNVFAEARSERRHSPRPVRGEPGPFTKFESLPDLDPSHFIVMTDSSGIMQHASYTVPDRHHGYSTDDQSRALVVAVQAACRRPRLADWNLLASRYLGYLLYAFDPETRRFGNYLTFQRQWGKPVAAEDVHARAVWALAHVVAHSQNRGHRDAAMQILELAVPPTTSFSSPRSWAYSILAVKEYLARFPGDSNFHRERRELAGRLLEQIKGNASDDWPWPENELTYANGRLPHALIDAGIGLENDEMLEWGLRSLGWLEDVQRSEEEHFAPVGTAGWLTRGNHKARFDQQPVEAYTSLEAFVAAYRATGDEHWLRAARRAFDWFLGRNDLSTPLYDYATGGCCDGLHPDRVNQNQGAESTICWLLSLLLMYELQEYIELQKRTARGTS